MTVHAVQTCWFMSHYDHFQTRVLEEFPWIISFHLDSILLSGLGSPWNGSCIMKWLGLIQDVLVNPDSNRFPGGNLRCLQQRPGRSGSPPRRRRCSQYRGRFSAKCTWDVGRCSHVGIPSVVRRMLSGRARTALVNLHAMTSSWRRRWWWFNNRLVDFKSFKDVYFVHEYIRCMKIQYRYYNVGPPNVISWVILYPI